MKWITSKIREFFIDFGVNRFAMKSKSNIVAVRRLNCYDEIEIVYMRKKQVNG